MSSIYSPTEAASDLASQLATMRTELSSAQASLRAMSKTHALVVKDSLPNTLRAMHRAQSTERDPGKAGTIYCREIKPLFDNDYNCGNHLRARENFSEVMRCANTLGTLNGNLIAQRCLDLIKYQLPVLNRITTNLSAEPVKFNQVVYTRIRAIPPVSSYNAPAEGSPYTTGYGDSAVTDTDVPVTINQHKAVQIVYTANDLASTARQLFPEQEEGMHFSIALDLTNSLTSLMTLANYPGAAVGGVGYGVQGSGSQTVCALDQFARPFVISMKTALNLRGVTGGMRTLLLQELYHGQLETDTTIVGNLINRDSGDSIMEGTLPIIAGFKPLPAPYLPTNNISLQGFGFRSDALVLAMRAPNDYSTVFPGVDGGGVVQTVTNPDSGMSVMLVMFIDHQAGTARLRLAWMYGTAVGNPVSGQLLTSV
jgi:hypothetical protein